MTDHGRLGRVGAQASGPIETARSEHLFQMYIACSYLSKLTNDEKTQARVTAFEQAGGQ